VFVCNKADIVGSKHRLRLLQVLPLSLKTMLSDSGDTNPTDPVSAQPTIGLIGMGAMGKMYANHLAKAGWKK
jgi:hypothetical protein